MLAIFQRAAERGLARLGEPSFLEGAPCGNVSLQRNVEVFASLLDQANDNYSVPRDVAFIERRFNPRVGQVLVHPDGTFLLDKLIEDNGVTRRFTIVKHAPP